jgi:hypothetical protein
VDASKWNPPHSNLVDAVAGAITVGEFAAADPTDVAQRLWSVAHGAVSLELRGLGFVEDQAALFDRLLETVLLGLSR